jgi:hypothetical protein
MTWCRCARVVLQEASLTAMIREEFEAADVDNEGKVSLEEWQKAAHGQERLRK